MEAAERLALLQEPEDRSSSFEDRWRQEPAAADQQTEVEPELPVDLVAPRVTAQPDQECTELAADRARVVQADLEESTAAPELLQEASTAEEQELLLAAEVAIEEPLQVEPEESRLELQLAAAGNQVLLLVAVDQQTAAELVRQRREPYPRNDLTRSLQHTLCST